VHQHLRVVLGAAERLEPRRGAFVPLGAGSARNLAVGHVAHEQVAEGVLALAGDRRAPLAADELLSLERMQPRLAFVALDSAHGAGRPEPEHLPEHRCVLQQLLLGRRQAVEPRRDDPLELPRADA
jgi:hypothetical protein